jgi:hypothetical protein
MVIETDTMVSFSTNINKPLAKKAFDYEYH